MKKIISTLFFIYTTNVFFINLPAVAQIITAEKMREKYSNDLLKELSSNINLIEGIEILIADSTYDRIESAWGHAALRLLSKRQDLDFVVDFVPKENITIRTAHKGLAGGFPIMPVLSKFKAWRRNYSLYEQRDINSVFIPSTISNREQLIKNITDLLNTNINYDYYFLSQNCISFLFKMLKAAGFEFIPNSTQLPKSAPITLLTLGLTPYPSKVISTPKEIAEEQSKPRNNSNMKELSLFRQLARITEVDPNNTEALVANSNNTQDLVSIWNTSELKHHCDQSKEIIRILKSRSLLAHRLQMNMAEQNMLLTISMVQKLCL